jgi:NitT/TauT family transport system substrate-binding protein
VALLGLLSGIVLLAACAPGAGAPKPQSGAPGQGAASASPAELLPSSSPVPLARVRYAHPTAAVQYLYLFVAQEQGFYRAHGLDVELSQLAPNILLAALSAGEVDYTAGAPGGIRLALQGQPLKVVSAVALQGYTLLTPPSITAAEQLRGRPVGISAPGSAGDQAMRRGLQHIGLDPETDVTRVTMGDPARQVDAIRAGAVDAVATTLPYIVFLEREGYRVWVRTETLYRALLSGLVARQGRIDGARNEVVGVLQAEADAVRFMRTQREAGAAILAKRLDLPLDVVAAVYEQTLDLYLDTHDPNAARDALEWAIASEQAAAGPEATKQWSDLVDTSLAREIGDVSPPSAAR